MSASDQLRNLHAAIEDAGIVRQSRGMAEIDTAWELLPLIADAIAAAEQFVADVTDAVSDDPGGLDACIRVGAKWFISHDTQVCNALAALADALKDTRA